MALTGLEMFAIQGGASLLNGLFGGMSGQSEADARREQAELAYRQDKKAYKMKEKSLEADYKYAKKGTKIQRRNEKTLAAWKDKTNFQDWQHSLKIQDHEFRSQMAQYAKSAEIYGQQLSFNNMASEAAREAEYRRLQDATNEIAFQHQDLIIKSMEAEGVAAVKGQQGRSANKGDQSVVASLGRNQSILSESLLSARGETQAALKKIAADKYGADIAARAARMLQPERLPEPPQPLKTPIAKFQNPRKVKNFDLGPKPVMGYTGSSTAAWMGGASTAISGIAGAAIKAWGK